MKHHLEIVRIDGYHSFILNGKLTLQDSCDDLCNDLIEVFKDLKNIERFSMSIKDFDDNELEEYAEYLASKC